MKTTLQLLLLLISLGKVGLSTVCAQQVTVATDGSGKVRTIQAALNSLPAEAAKPRTVYIKNGVYNEKVFICLLYTSPSPRDLSTSRMPSSA